MEFFVFSTYMKGNGSYYWLCKRLADAVSQMGHHAVVVEDVLNYRGSPFPRDAIHVHITSLNAMVDFLKSEARKRFPFTYIIADSVLVKTPILQIPELEKKYNAKVFVPSVYNYLKLSKFIKVGFFPHVVPVEEFIPLEQRKTWFIIGANEPDYDRKGMFLAYWLKEAGFPIKAHCHNLCPPGFARPNVSNEQMDALWKDVKWYLAFSHAESPHLPLLEAYLHGIPAFYHDATDLHYLGVGVPLPTGYPQIRSQREILAWEYDYGKLWDAVATVYKFPEDAYRKLSQAVFDLGRKWFGKPRLKDFLNLDSVDYDPSDLLEDVKRAREVVPVV